MDKQRNNPIVAERDDMIGRSSVSSKGEASRGRDASSDVPAVWKTLALIAFFGCISITWFGWQKYQSFLVLQERFEVLDSRLNSTDESVNQSGAAMQVNISKHSEQLKKHWSEIRKLWGVANDKNKDKIDKNKKEIVFLANKRNELEVALKNLRAAAEKDRKNLHAASENYFGLSADMDQVNESLDNYLVALNRVQGSLKEQQSQLQHNIEAIKSMDAFRRQINQKVLHLEQQVAKRPVEQKIQTIEQQVVEQPLSE